MADIVLFHSVLGIRQGVLDAAARLESMGHVVRVPDLYGGGKVFDEYEPAMKFVEAMGYAALLERTRAAAAELPARVVYAGFSNGGASAEHLAVTRPGAAAAILFSAAIPVEAFAQIDGGAALTWPAGVPVQVHYTTGDPFREQAELDGLRANVEGAGAPFVLYEYAGNGHLFTDRTLPGEYDEAASELLWERVEAFLRDIP